MCLCVAVANVASPISTCPPVNSDFITSATHSLPRPCNSLAHFPPLAHTRRLSPHAVTPSLSPFPASHHPSLTASPSPLIASLTTPPLTFPPTKCITYTLHRLTLPLPHPSLALLEKPAIVLPSPSSQLLGEFFLSFTPFSLLLSPIHKLSPFSLFQHTPETAFPNLSSITPKPFVLEPLATKMLCNFY